MSLIAPRPIVTVCRSSPGPSASDGSAWTSSRVVQRAGSRRCRGHRRRVRRRPPVAPTDNPFALGVTSGDPDERRRCCGPGWRRRTVAARRRRHRSPGSSRPTRRSPHIVGTGRGRPRRRGSQRARRRRRRRPRGSTGSAGAVDEAAPVESPRPADATGSAAPGGGVVPALRDGVLRRPPRLAAWAPTSSCSSATSSTSTAAETGRRAVVRSHGTGGDVHARRLPQSLRPVPRRCRSPGVAGGVPVAGDLGRPRGREQLCVVDLAVHRRRPTVRRPPARRLPGVVGAHAGADRPAEPARRHPIIYRTIGGASSPT